MKVPACEDFVPNANVISSSLRSSSNLTSSHRRDISKVTRSASDAKGFYSVVIRVAHSAKISELGCKFRGRPVFLAHVVRIISKLYPVHVESSGVTRSVIRYCPHVPCPVFQ